MVNADNNGSIIIRNRDDVDKNDAYNLGIYYKIRNRTVNLSKGHNHPPPGGWLALYGLLC